MIKYSIILFSLLLTVATFNLDTPLLLNLTLAINVNVFSFVFLKTLDSKNFNPFLVITYIFYLLFFIVAPIIQLGNDPKNLLNGLTLKPNDSILSNFLILVSFLTIFVSFNYYKKNKSEISARSHLRKKLSRIKIYRSLLVLSFSSVIISLPFLFNSLSDNSTIFSGGETKSSILIIKKFVMMIPFAALVYLFGIKNRLENKKQYWATLIIILFCLLILKNPITEKRNAIGPIYLTIIFFFTESKLNSNKAFFKYIFVLFVVFFPLSSILTHSYGSLDERLSGLASFSSNSGFIAIIISHFKEIHYDAWNMVITTIGYVRDSGLSFGYFLMGSLFFFIPRSIWENKPLGTGETIVNDYVSSIGSDFANVSCPFPAEAYVNFGIFGILLFSILLSKYFHHLYLKINSNDTLKYFGVYFAFYLFFLYRGDLMNSVAYYFGFVLAYLFVVKVANFKISK